jgi:hypothetical protein
MRHLLWPIPEVVRVAAAERAGREVDAGGNFTPIFSEDSIDVSLPPDAALSWEVWNIEEVFLAISAICWGKWCAMHDLRAESLPPAAIREVAYLILPLAMQRARSESFIINTVMQVYVSEMSARAQQAVRRLVCNVLKSVDLIILARRLERIENLMLVALYVGAAKHLSRDLLVYSVDECLPNVKWTVQDDKALVYAVYAFGYGGFRRSFQQCSYGMLCERLRVLCRAYKSHITTDPGFHEHSTLVPIAPSATRPIIPPDPGHASAHAPISAHRSAAAHGSAASPAEERQRSGRRVLDRLPPPDDAGSHADRPSVSRSDVPFGFSPSVVTLEPLWGAEEQRVLARAIENYGELSATELRNLLPLYDKSDESINATRDALVAYAKQPARPAPELVFLPEAPVLAQSLALFARLRAADRHAFYVEDAVILDIVAHRGIAGATRSPILRHEFPGKLTPDCIRKIVLETLSRRGRPLSESQKAGLRGFTPVVPVVVAEGIEIVGYGGPKCYCQGEFVYPVGYTAMSEYIGDRTVCCILEGPDDTPLFRITTHLGYECTCSGPTPEAAWEKYFKFIRKLALLSGDRCRSPGHELFGLLCPLVRRVLQEMPGAEAVKRQLLAFRTPPQDLVNMGLLLAEHTEEKKTDGLVFNFSSIIKTPGIPRLVMPAAPLMELLGPHVLTKEDLRNEIRRFADAFDFDLSIPSKPI